MHINEIPEGSQITVIASIDDCYLEFPTTIVTIANDTVIVEPIRNNEGKPISLVSDKIRIDVSFVEDEKKSPFLWKNVTVNYGKLKNKPYHIINQTTDGKRENRRGAYRLFVGESAELNMLDVPGGISVILKDISATGFSFVHYGDIQVPKYCKLTCSFDNKVLVLSGTIVRKQVMDNGSTVYGCKLERFSKELEKLIASKQREVMNKKLK